MEEISKRFELEKDGSVKMFVKEKQELKLSHAGQMMVIGHQERDIVNTVSKEHVKVLRQYLKNQQQALEAGIQQAEDSLEKLKLVDENAMPKKTAEAIHKYLADKQKVMNKKAQQEMIHLSRYINDMNKKKATKEGLQNMKVQLEAVKKEVGMLEAVLPKENKGE